jgi:hypothetical protein
MHTPDPVPEEPGREAPPPVEEPDDGTTELKEDEAA